MDDRLWCNATPNYRLQRGFTAVRHDLGINPPLAFEKAKDRGFARCASPSFAAHSACPKVRFIHFDFSVGKGRLLLTGLSQALANLAKNAVDGFARQPSQNRYIRGR